ncbi:hypothetical protein CYMTET_46438 [Cymbomonas tetramitiformis]|uniref:Uncharacterized protein n=1 Tax=Cymbomonas tetramitiformis TaxID=36881 RepID=A0AAE0BXD2_9CHLO|nr:hypothetical protein CYMTET_46438 [Cymbomonas tetramitiformis]
MRSGCGAWWQTVATPEGRANTKALLKAAAETAGTSIAHISSITADWPMQVEIKPQDPQEHDFEPSFELAPGQRVTVRIVRAGVGRRRARVQVRRLWLGQCLEFCLPVAPQDATMTLTLGEQDMLTNGKPREDVVTTNINEHTGEVISLEEHGGLAPATSLGASGGDTLISAPLSQPVPTRAASEPDCRGPKARGMSGEVPVQPPNPVLPAEEQDLNLVSGI